jgi:hypothetical protein
MLAYILYIAIHLASIQHLSTRAVDQYVQEIERQSDITGVSSLMFITIITHESQWSERAISKDGLDYGLMQVRAQYYGGKPELLLNGVTNIKAGGAVITKSIQLCRKFLKREPETQEWLACYTGSCNNYHNMCRPTRLTQKFMDYETCLEQEVMGPETKSQCQKKFK